MNSIKRNIHEAWKFLFMLILLVITFMYAMFQGGFVSWFLFYSFLPIAIYSIVLAVYPIKSMKVERILNQTEYKMGDELIAVIKVTRSIPFPLFYVLVEEILPERFHDCQFKEEPKGILFPGFKRKFSFHYHLTSIPRGEHQFQSIRLKIGDLFGFVEKEINIPIHDYILVYPQYVDIKYKQKLSLAEGTSVSNRSYIKDTSIAVGVRDYEPGDRLSWIDWKATARRETIMTKEFETLKSEDVLVMMDRAESPFFEQIVTYTASFVRSALKSGVKVGFVSIGKEKTAFMTENHEEHLKKIFYHLAIVKDNAIKPFTEVVQEQLQKNQNKSSIVLITASLTRELVHMLEQYGLHKKISIYLVKDIKRSLLKEERQLLEKLLKRNIKIEVVYEESWAYVSKRGEAYEKASV